MGEKTYRILDGATLTLDDTNMTFRVIGSVRPLSLPQPVANLRLQEVADDFVTLLWDDGDDATSWRVDRSDDGGPYATLDTIDKADGPTYTDSTVSADSDYTYRVVAINADGPGPASDELDVHTEAAPPGAPDTPTGVDYDGPDGRGRTMIRLRWDNPNIATPGAVANWTIKRDTVTVGTVTSPLFNDTGLTEETDYDYDIIANNAAGASSAATFTGTTLANSPPEWGTFSLPDATVGQAYNFNLRSQVTDQDLDTLVISLTGGSLPAGLTHTDGVINGTPTASGSFSPEFSAYDGFDTVSTGALSLLVNALPDVTDPTIPGKPTASVTGTDVTLVWTGSTDPAGPAGSVVSGVKQYNVRRDNVFIASVPADTLTYTDIGRPPGTYTYQVRAEDFTGNISNSSPASDPVIVTNPNPNPGPPTNFAASSSGANSVLLSWGVPSSGPAPNDYDADWSTAPGTGQGAPPWNPITISGVPNPLQKDVTGLSTGVQHYFRIKAKATTGESGYVFATATPNERNLFASATFENGTIGDQPSTRSTKAIRNSSAISCKAIAKVQTAGSQSKWANAGDGPALFNAAEVGGAEDYELHVCDGETVVLNGVSDTITPREGGYFMRSYLHAGNNNNSTAQTPNAQAPNITDGFRHYEGPNRNTLGDNAAHDGPICKPRSESGLSNRAAYGIPYDTRMFHAFSLRLHKDHEVVRKSNGNAQASNGSGPQLGEMNPGTTGVAGSILVFSCIIPETGFINALDTQTPKRTIGQTVGAQTDHWWCIKISYSTTSDQENEAGGHIALCPIGTGTGGASDRGKWTDFVLELCLNPYTVATTDNGWNFRGADAAHPNGYGLLRVWKSTGPYLGTGNGMNRSMSETADYVNGTQGGLIYERVGKVGLRPPLATPRDPKDMAPINIGAKHYAYMYRPEIPGGIDCTHGSYLGMAAHRQTYAENRQHSAINGSENSNMVTQYQGGVAGKWSDVVPRG